jgi:hypothetical protein
MIGAASALLLGVLWIGSIAAQTATHDSSAATSGIKTIVNPSGGKIYFGAVAGQTTPQDALGKTLHRVSLLYGDRPQLGKLVQNSTGEILAGFFTVTAKNQDGKPMTGLALAYAPKSGSAGGAVLIDNADRFPSTVNSMFTRLKQELGKAPTPASAPASAAAAHSSATGSAANTAAGSAQAAAPVKAAPAQPLQRVLFTDGTGAIGLPAGWQTQHANMGDVAASGPRGEKLRFGWAIPVIDPTDPKSATLMPNRRAAAPANFVAIPYGTDAATSFKSAFSQMFSKSRKAQPGIDIAKVQDIPLQGGKNYMLYGTIDFRDGSGKQYFVSQMINTMPQSLGTWQMMLFFMYGPQQVMGEEANTVGAIFPSYTRDNKRVADIANVQIQQTIAQTNQFLNQAAQYMDNSDRTTAGMSDILRDQTVVLDTQTGGHARTSDDLAGALIDANPNRFQTVPLGSYVKGIDY